MARIADPLREYVGTVRAYHLTDIHGKKREYVDATTRELLEIADRIDAEHKRRMEQCRRGTRRDFARYVRSCIADYVDGTARRNRNHAHARVAGDGSATCTNCDTSIGAYDNYCCRCGAKITATEYESTDESDDTCELEFTFNRTYASCNKCQYTIPHGTNLLELKECPNCGRRIVWEGC